TVTTVQTLAVLARACRRAKRYELAYECLGEAEELAKPLEGLEWRARIHLERGLLHLAAGTDRAALDEADQNLQRVLELLNDRETSRTVLDAHEALVDVCLKQGD